MNILLEDIFNAYVNEARLVILKTGKLKNIVFVMLNGLICELKINRLFVMCEV